LLPEELLREVLGKHKCLFGGVFHSAIVTWVFLCQVMRDGKDARCQAAVAGISNFLIQIEGAWHRTRGRDLPAFRFGIAKVPGTGREDEICQYSDSGIEKVPG
jgi:hypothetical protein